MRTSRTDSPVVGVGFVEEPGQVVPDPRNALRVVEELCQPREHLVHDGEVDRRAHTAWHDRLRMRVFPADEHVRFARDAGHVERFEVQAPGERVEIFHQSADHTVSVNRGVRGFCRVCAVEQTRVGRRDHRRRVVGPGEQVQMQRMVVEEFERQRDVADRDAQLRRSAADRHLDGHRRGHRMHASADAARAAGDEDGVARVATDHDDFVAAEQCRHRAGLEHPSLLEVGDGVKGQGSRHAGDRIEVNGLDVPVPADQLLDSFGGHLDRRPCRHRRARGRVRVEPVFEERASLFVEFDRQVLEAHEGSLRGRTRTPPGRDAGRQSGGRRPGHSGRR